MTVGVPHDMQPGVLHSPFGVRVGLPPGERVQVPGVPAMQFQQRTRLLLHERAEQVVVRVLLPPGGGSPEHSVSLPARL